MSKSRTECWNHNYINFVELDGVWYASFTDICGVLEIDPEDTLDFFSYNELPGMVVDESGLSDDLYIDEQGVYQCMFLSSSVDSVNLQQWTASVLKRLRIQAGLSEWEIFRMCDPDVQDEISAWLDSIFYNEETQKLYISKTVPGGDVEQIEIENVFAE